MLHATMNRELLPLVFTPGEPAGIGPDLAVLATAHAPRPLVIAADPALLAARAKQLGRNWQAAAWDGTPFQGVRVLAVPTRAPVVAGRLDRANAAYVLDTLRAAVAGCLSGTFAGLVTGPVHKGVINDAGIPFTGHTEFLAELAHAGQPVMMLAARGLRVALVTTHLPLAEVPAAITQARVEAVLRVLHHDLVERFGIAHPRIRVCGLNPHAGEGGHLGREEIEVIEPVLGRLRAEGMTLFGPLPADTAFTQRLIDETDAFLAMYHDQGLPVLKHYGFGEAVNVTLGLPFVRTSVDHGTALDLAGSGAIETGSLHEALAVAAFMAARGSD